MLKRITAWVAIAGCVLLFAATAGAAPKIPPVPTRDIYAQDYANVLSKETESRINRLSSELQSRTGAQIAVVTIPSLEGETIEDYSLALFRKWGIGDRKKNNGVLILLAVAEKKSRMRAESLWSVLPRLPGCSLRRCSCRRCGRRREQLPQRLR